jgi:hypothetical protein
MSLEMVMQQIDLLHQNEAKLGHSFRRQVVSYIERCHLEDGGYFFARVPPSGGLDTFFAVKSFSILGIKPNRPEAIANFFLNDFKESTLSGITGIFLAVEVLNELGQMTDELRNYAQTQVMALQNEAGGFGALRNIYVEVSSELEETYRAVRILKIIGADFDEQRVSRLVFSLLNPDGGYGGKGYSTLASTFYATEIQKLLGNEIGKLTSTKGYLRKAEDNWRANFDNEQVDFIEHLYWLVKALANLGEKSNVPDRAAMFVLACQRPNGGFSRATIMGIPTLEYTFYALSILREAGAL